HPDIPVHCIVVDTSNTARLYVGTDLGVFVSIDGGSNWAVENTGFANVVTEHLALNANNDTLFAFTHGRGAGRVPLVFATDFNASGQVTIDGSVSVPGVTMTFTKVSGTGSVPAA